MVFQEIFKKEQLKTSIKLILNTEMAFQECLDLVLLNQDSD